MILIRFMKSYKEMKTKNKELFLTLVSEANRETEDGILYREEHREWLRESKRIALKVLIALKTKGMTQKELSVQMGVSPQYISKLVRGNENFTLETLVKLQRILQIPLLASYEKGEGLTPERDSL